MTRWQTIAVVSGVAGALLFVWTLRTAGAGAVVAGAERLGVGFVVVLLVGGMRYLLRAAAWRWSFDAGPPSMASAFAAYAAGDALGNVTPFGPLVSEPSKIVLTRGRVDPAAAVPALAVENLFYGASVAVMLLVGTAALLIVFDVPPLVRRASLAMFAATAAATVVAAWAIASRRRVASGIARRLGADTARITDVEDRVFRFGGGQPRRVLLVAALEAAYHAAAVFEIWFAIRAITGTPPTLVTALVLEYVNRAITVTFQFVPMWLGVDEAGTGAIASALGLGAASGVTLALVRKARMLAWTAVGLAVWGLSLRRAVDANRDLATMIVNADEDRHRRRHRIPRSTPGELAGR